MRTSSLPLVAALLPALALAAPQQPSGAAHDPAGQPEREKRLRVLRTVGLAEALDLDEAGALKLRDTLAKDDQRRAPLLRQVEESVRVLEAAARGDGGAAAQVDRALQRLVDVRGKLVQLDAELLTKVTQGATPARKARAALFLAQEATEEEPAADAGAARAPPALPPGPRAYARPSSGPPYYTPSGVPPPASPPEEIEPPGSWSQAPGAPARGPAGPEPEDWFSDSP